MEIYFHILFHLRGGDGMDACSINYILDDIFISLQLLTMDMTDI